MYKRAAPNMGGDAPAVGSRQWTLRDIELDERTYELRIGGRLARIEPKPLAVFMVLLRNPDRVVGPRELAATVWGGRPVSEQVIAQSIARLRRALGPDHIGLVRTVHGWGYRLTEVPAQVTLEHPHLCACGSPLLSPPHAADQSSHTAAHRTEPLHGNA